MVNFILLDLYEFHIIIYRCGSFGLCLRLTARRLGSENSHSDETLPVTEWELHIIFIFVCLSDIVLAFMKK